ncbi:MtnX-like HAD-IB family phosphatase [Tepidibacter thalassicus]|uniref:Haloacid Dehalogenase superfamily, subfamily IB, phosphoserine phosphatase-like/2,3-diketo-5-methylthio-1-phosphopentane phosphatase n=1 Tax=Tepidibacter thalassicus DSM 15285 TaxID=1123350 RepID=A0A1M5SIJ7_9FIRM|nr:MtnX-like HAD-IB family phosphatase [Tepidibacter thalassicus]SHH37723.1 Haloacid Dehalogenase superfamily, subfamily IB, phosphoserine phosphatase-like/2,3-diketo-5-methylthio-1-phosphopentane phosphatase [Tepidibacter thalassicus DSM 15285]
MEYIIICDFDGTITLNDTVNAMADEFSVGDWRKLDEMWICGKCSGSEVSQKILEMIDTDEHKLREFIKNIKIDPYFKEFMEYIKEKVIEFYIVSDGFDFNIETILEENEIIGVICFSNMLQFEGKKLMGFYPNVNEDCKKCGNCKRNIITNVNIENKKIIYIGDGYSDRCAAKLGDYIFAKGELANHLKEENIDFIEFNNFKDILLKIKEII